MKILLTKFQPIEIKNEIKFSYFDRLKFRKFRF